MEKKQIRSEVRAAVDKVRLRYRKVLDRIAAGDDYIGKTVEIETDGEPVVGHISRISDDIVFITLQVPLSALVRNDE